MAEMVFKNAVVKMGSSAAPSTWIHRYIRSITVNYKVEVLDKTAMQSSGRGRIAGLKDASVNIEFNQDYADNKVDETLNGYLGASSTAVWIGIRPTTSPVGAGNPNYTGRYVMESYNPVSGSVGDLGTVSASFMCDGIVTRRVA